MGAVMRFLLITLMLVSTSLAQEGKDTGRWNFIEYDKVSESVVLLEVTYNSVAGPPLARGSGTVVNKTVEPHPTKVGYVKCEIYTSNHVVEDSSNIRVLFQGGGESLATVTGSIGSDKGDVAILTSYVPDRIHGLILGDVSKELDAVRIIGYGQTKDVNTPRYFSGVVRGVAKNYTHIDANCLSGDSGGAIVNQNGQLIGILSGGADWFPLEGKKYSYTWPIRASNLKSIQKVRNMAKLKPSIINPIRLPNNPDIQIIPNVQYPFQHLSPYRQQIYDPINYQPHGQVIHDQQMPILYGQ